jgi:hypothetical protein
MLGGFTNYSFPSSSMSLDWGNTGYRTMSSMQSWISQSRSIGIGYARKAHPGVYLQIDWPDFNRFVQKQIYSTKVGTQQGIFNISKKLYGKIRERNPVLTGLSKRSWEMRIKGLANPQNPYVIIANQVFYVVFLEFGSSTKAPHGMVRISMKEMMGIPAREILLQIKKERLTYNSKAVKLGKGASRTLNLAFGGNL